MNAHDRRMTAMAAARDNPAPFSGREPPNNLEAEQALLGALLVNNEAYGRIIPTGIEAKHFHEPIHRVFFEAIRECIAAKRIANPVTIRSFVAPSELTKPVGDMSTAQYAARLAGDAVSIINAPDYAEAIIFYARRREVLPAADIIEHAAFSAEDEIAFADELREARDRLTHVLYAVERRDEDHGSFAGTAGFNIWDEHLC